MSYSHGMNPDAIREQANRIDAVVNDLKAVEAAIERTVSSLGQQWRGPDLERFGGWWRDQHKPNLTRISESIAGLAQSTRTTPRSKTAPATIVPVHPCLQSSGISFPASLRESSRLRSLARAVANCQMPTELLRRHSTRTSTIQTWVTTGLAEPAAINARPGQISAGGSLGIPVLSAAMVVRWPVVSEEQ